MLKISIISICFSLTLLHAGSFEFTSIKRDSSEAISNNGLKIKSEKNVIATGYGTTHQHALNNAFKSAVEQYVGVVVDNETIMKNGKLIKDNILTASNGFIKTYKELSVDQSDGFIEVQINATVKSQEVFNKIKSLNITTISIKDLNGISSKVKDMQARKATQIKAKEDSDKILKKVLNDFLSNESLQDMLTIVITDVIINEEEVKDYKVPMNISYTLELDYKIYSQKVKQLEQVFENIGAKLQNRVDLPYVDYGYAYQEPHTPNKPTYYRPKGKKRKSELLMLVKNTKKIQNLSFTDFGILKQYGQGFKLDIWEFPKAWNDIYLFNPEKQIIWEDIFQIILELHDNNGEVLYAENITPRGKNNLLLAVIRDNYYAPYVSGNSYRTNPKILMPLFNTLVEKFDFTTRQMINVNHIDKIKNITIELEEK